MFKWLTGRNKRPDWNTAISDFMVWHDKEFPIPSPDACFAHFLDEVEELRVDPSSAEEIVDCIQLLLALANDHGIDLPVEFMKKTAILHTRTWGPPDERGVRHHV